MTERWTVDQAREYFGKGGGIKEKPRRRKGNGNKIKWEMEMVLKLAGIAYEKEYQFHSKRKFRFDWAIPSIKVGIEYEGLMSAKSRHTTVTGFTRDAEKYNLAQAEGWKVLRYTALNYEQLINDIMKLI